MDVTPSNPVIGWQLWLTEKAPNPPLAVSPDIATSIWSLKITPKIKHFLWRLLSRAIGVAENLRRRHIHVNPFCTRCCLEVETSNHTFFTCPHARAIWRAAGIPTSQLSDTSSSLEDKFRLILQFHKDTTVAEVTRFLPFWLMWRIWKSRNDMVFNRKAIDPLDTLHYAIADTKEWIDNQNNPGASDLAIPINHTRFQRWCKPARGWVKCNYDASHLIGDRPSGLGWIIRDPYGTFLHCGMGQFQGRITSIEAECTALLWALQSTWALGYQYVEFEGDNLFLNQLLNDKRVNLRLKHYIVAIQQWRNVFLGITFSFKYREQNSCADCLAKRAIISPNQWCLYHSCPFFLSPFVNNDYDVCL